MLSFSLAQLCSFFLPLVWKKELRPLCVRSKLVLMRQCGEWRTVTSRGRSRCIWGSAFYSQIYNQIDSFLFHHFRKKNIFHCYHLPMAYHSFVWPPQTEKNSGCSFDNTCWKEWQELKNKAAISADTGQEIFFFYYFFFSETKLVCKGGWQPWTSEQEDRLGVIDSTALVLYPQCAERVDGCSAKKNSSSNQFSS